MKSEKNITRGGLSGKMDGFRPEPPASVWEGVAAGLRGKRSGRKIFIFLAVAAGLAMAITVGITLFTNPAPQEIATLEETATEPKPAAATTETSPSAATTDTSPAAATTDKSPSAATTDKSPSAVTTDASPVAATTDTSPAAATDPLAEAQGAQDRSEALAVDNPQEGVGAGAQDIQGVPADGKQQNTTGTGIDTEKSRTENVSRLEQKVITAMQEVMNEKIADQSGAAGEGQDSKAVDGQLQVLSDNDRQVVNEDSLVRLLKEGAGPAGEGDMEVPVDRRPGKWQLGATLSPLISYRDVASADVSQNVAVNHSESARLTYAGGVGVSYLPSDRFTIQTGIYYNKMGVNIGEYSSFKSGWFESAYDMVSAPGRSESVVSISNSMGTVISGDEERFVNNYSGTGTLTDYHMLKPEEMIVADASVESFSQTFEYLEIPFNVRYKIIDRSIDLQIMGGFSTNFLVNNSVTAIAGDQAVAIGKVEDVRTFNYSGNAGVGIVYDLFKNFSFSLEPRFRYYLNSINTPELPVTRPYTFGLYTGVNYKF